MPCQHWHHLRSTKTIKNQHQSIQYSQSIKKMKLMKYRQDNDQNLKTRRPTPSNKKFLQTFKDSGKVEISCLLNTIYISILEKSNRQTTTESELMIDIIRSSLTKGFSNAVFKRKLCGSTITTMIRLQQVRITMTISEATKETKCCTYRIHWVLPVFFQMNHMKAACRLTLS